MTAGIVDRSFPIVLCGPSGSGKSTVIRELLARRDDLRFSVSATTRRPRTDERPGVDYTFTTRARFEGLTRGGEMLEWAEVHGELYGTPRENLSQALSDRKHLLLDIDVQGARQVRSSVPEAVTIFLLPPRGAWLDRLRTRGSESRGELLRRLRSAEAELKEVGDFEYVVVNDQLTETIRRLESILEAEESRTPRLGKQLSRFASDLQRELAVGLRQAADGR